MCIRKVIKVSLLSALASAGYCYNPFVSSVYTTEALGNPNVLTAIDTTAPLQVGYDTLKLILQPVDGGTKYYFEPFVGLSTMPIEDPITSTAVSRDFFCVELERDLNVANTVYKKFDTAGKIGWLLDQVTPTNKTNQSLMAGLQLAIWEVAYDGTNGNAYNLSDGIFKTDAMFDGFTNQAAAKAAAQSWLSSLAQMGQSKAYAYYHSPGDSHNKADYQDLVSAVPEPTTIAGLALGAIALIKRRRK